MTPYENIQKKLRTRPATWLVTGCAGFIGSHLTEKLLSLGQRVVGLDNFATGHKDNLVDVRRIVGEQAWKRFTFIRGDLRNIETCRRAVKGVHYVLHQAALGSVPRSVEDPILTNEANVSGFLNILTAARDAQVKGFVYASSSAVYGDEETLPKVEERIGKPLSPYAVSKYVNELYADVFGRCYRFATVGLRYFNVFGPRQDPNGPYAAVIPRWMAAMEKGDAIYINGDGETSRDFSYIANIVQANILAATNGNGEQVTRVFNVACNERTTLNELFSLLREALLSKNPHLRRVKPKYKPFRAGDVRHSQADISFAVKSLGYTPTHHFADGLAETVALSAGRQSGGA
jgi:UDP-N-acetylglucosamine 4-epimerase